MAFSQAPRQKQSVVELMLCPSHRFLSWARRKEFPSRLMIRTTLQSSRQWKCEQKWCFSHSLRKLRASIPSPPLSPSLPYSLPLSASLSLSLSLPHWGTEEPKPRFCDLSVATTRVPYPTAKRVNDWWLSEPMSEESTQHGQIRWARPWRDEAK